MSASEPIKRVRIYLSERDTSEGQPLYLVALEWLRREGATGATALRGVAGFGAGHRMRAGGMIDLGQQAAPMVIEWVDRAERIGRVLPTLDELLPDALITIEDVRVYRAVLRGNGPFGSRSVGEVLDREAPTVAPNERFATAIARLVAARRSLLPVVGAGGQIAGLIGDVALRRHGLPLTPVLAALPTDERDALLARLPATTVAEELGAEARTIYIETSIAQAVSVLIEWGLDALPVADRDGRFAGLFGTDQALGAALAAHPAETRVRDAEPPPVVSLIMQMLVPSTPANTPLPTALTQLLAATGRFLVVVNGWQPVGALNEAEVTAALPDELRAAWVEALCGRHQALTQAFEGAGTLTAGDIASRPVALVKTRATQSEAIGALLEHGHERLVAVDDEGRLAGMVTRRGLLRALAQSGG